jgi:uncharacterized membrane protein YdbT with pleckstrin-like domain
MLHLDPEEQILAEVRKHWFVFFAYGFFLVLAAILPVAGFGVLEHFLRDFLPADNNFEILVAFTYSLWLLALWASFFVQWTNYYLDVWYITDKRIIDIDQKGLFYREVSNLRFDKIQDVTIEVRGLIATFLDFGDIRVQTASENSKDFFMSHAARPDKIRKLIFEQHNKVAESPLKIVPHGK